LEQAACIHPIGRSLCVHPAPSLPCLPWPKIFLPGPSSPPFRAGPVSIRSGEEGFRSLEFRSYPENLTLSWNYMPAERFHAILDLAALPRTHSAPCSARWIRGSARALMDELFGPQGLCACPWDALQMPAATTLSMAASSTTQPQLIRT
jgi:hypothetical protein